MVILSSTPHQKVEVFRMWSGPRNVTTIAHAPISSSCLVIMSCTPHQKVEVFMMWLGPRNVMVVVHAPIYGIFAQLVCVKS